MSHDRAISDVIDDRLDGYRERLFDLLAQPSVSTTGEGMDAAAALVVDTVEAAGFRATRVETDRHPLVYAEFDPAGADARDGAGREPGADVPTVLFYGHYDVQPPGDPDEWDSPAFEPTVRDGAIYARGAGDNKGQFIAHAFAVDALRAADAVPDVRVKLLIEGGEESGSAGFRAYLRDDPDVLADVDLVYVADGPRHAVARPVLDGDEASTGDSGAMGDNSGTTGDDSGAGRRGVPTLIYGNRGVLAFEVECRTANTDLHSGNFGGPVPAATNELVAGLSSMRADGTDEITVDGFHDGIEVTDGDRELVAAIPDDGDEIREELGLSRLAGEVPYYEQLLTRPTMTINGLSGGYQGEGMKTVLPNEASAKLDCRLVPNQVPDAVFEAIRDHLLAVNPELTVTKRSTFPPVKTPVDAPEATVVADALESVWGASPIELPVLGGSLPAAYFRTLDALSDVPILVVPYANHDQGNHSPNEHLDLDCFENGIRTTAAVLRGLEGPTATRE
ncbi:M20/M25/M40 family metallo-hydrolase [Halorubrum tibetense]|uniref:M20/M25/M40 family metallo-hydrolase n=1 Tax=Halorubrum tibetense TaxID=175631 RepID=A0ABD5SAH9_9EURY